MSPASGFSIVLRSTSRQRRRSILRITEAGGQVRGGPTLACTWTKLPVVLFADSLDQKW